MSLISGNGMLCLTNPRPGPKPRGRVEILGVFGSGKTSLARRLAEDAGDMLAEDHFSNPFWGDEHALAIAGYLGYDLGFLIHHAHLAASRASRPGIAICDWSFATDRLWASMRLGEAFNAYDAVHRSMGAKLERPRFYVHLDVSSEVIVERLERRGRPFEAGFARHVEEAAQRVRTLVEELPQNVVMRTTGDDVGPLVQAIGSDGDSGAGEHEPPRRHP